MIAYPCSPLFRLTVNLVLVFVCCTTLIFALVPPTRQPDIPPCAVVKEARAHNFNKIENLSLVENVNNKQHWNSSKYDVVMSYENNIDVTPKDGAAPKAMIAFEYISSRDPYRKIQTWRIYINSGRSCSQVENGAHIPFSLVTGNSEIPSQAIAYAFY
jgi:hypothetical protein